MKEQFNPQQVYARTDHKPTTIHTNNDTEAEALSPIKLGQLVKCSHHGTSNISVLIVVGISMTKEEKEEPYFRYYLTGMRGIQQVSFYSFGQVYIKPLLCGSLAELNRVRIKWCN